MHKGKWQRWNNLSLFNGISTYAYVSLPPVFSLLHVPVSFAFPFLIIPLSLSLHLAPFLCQSDTWLGNGWEQRNWTHDDSFYGRCVVPGSEHKAGPALRVFPPGRLWTPDSVLRSEVNIPSGSIICTLYVYHELGRSTKHVCMSSSSQATVQSQREFPPILWPWFVTITYLITKLLVSDLFFLFYQYIVYRWVIKYPNFFSFRILSHQDSQDIRDYPLVTHKCMKNQTKCLVCQMHASR